MPTKPISLAKIREIARDKFGYSALRPGQEETILALLDGHDTLSVMPTGSGKSAIYQIVGLLLNGPTVVVSPLIALQKDQVDSIEEKGLADAAVVNSTQRVSERREAMESLEGGSLEFLFLSPEQLANEQTLAQLEANPPSLFVVDEAHCLSEWGHDFRPDYARLGGAIERLGHPRVLALTATASPAVQRHIVESLGMKEPKTIVWGFDRPNIWIGVEDCPDRETKRRLILDRVKDNAKPAIVYVATRAHAEEVARQLREEANIDAAHYHGGMNKDERTKVQDAFMADDQAVIVATNAFGMGVDKPNVRTVIHYDVPESLDAYYQEIGRAGRDGKPARAILLFNSGDLGMRRAQASAGKLTQEQVERIFSEIQDNKNTEPASIADATELSKSKVATAINRLEEIGAVRRKDAGAITLNPRINAETAARQVVAEQEEYRQHRISRVDLVRDFAQTQDCRRRYILSYFGETLAAEVCDNCDNCKAGLARQHAAEQLKLPFPIKGRVSHKKYGSGIVMRYEGENVIVAFDEAGPKQLNTAYVIDNDLIVTA